MMTADDLYKLHGDPVEMFLDRPGNALIEVNSFVRECRRDPKAFSKGIAHPVRSNMAILQVAVYRDNLNSIPIDCTHMLFISDHPE